MAAFLESKLIRFALFKASFDSSLGFKEKPSLGSINIRLKEGSFYFGKSGC
jgi:hypothetical protein